MPIGGGSRGGRSGPAGPRGPRGPPGSSAVASLLQTTLTLSASTTLTTEQVNRYVLVNTGSATGTATIGLPATAAVGSWLSVRCIGVVTIAGVAYATDSTAAFLVFTANTWLPM